MTEDAWKQMFFCTAESFKECVLKMRLYISSEVLLLFALMVKLSQWCQLEKNVSE